MSPEEQYNKEKWWVLQKLKLLDLQTPNPNKYEKRDRRGDIVASSPRVVEYCIIVNPNFIGGEEPKHSVQKNILTQLVNDAVIKVINEDGGQMIFTEYYMHIEILKPKFDEVYKKYETIENEKINQVLIEDALLGIPSEKLFNLKNHSSASETKVLDANVFPYKLPSGTIWETIIITFTDEENILIRVNGKQVAKHYTEIDDFTDKRNSKPNLQWKFLLILAKYSGELSPKDSEVAPNLVKAKEALSNALKKYFKIDYDPFYPYNSSPVKEGNSYKIKITLLPPAENGKKYNHSNLAEPSIDEELKTIFEQTID